MPVLETWEYCIVEWTWDDSTIRVVMPSNSSIVDRGSYAELVQALTRLGSEGWEVTGCAGTSNWLLWTLKHSGRVNG